MRYATIIVGSVVFALGCSTASGDLERPPGAVTEVAEPLSNHEHCDTAAADATIRGLNGGTATSTRSYSHPESCNNGFMVDVLTGGNFFGGTVSWADLAPTTAGECVGARILSYVWDKGIDGDPNASVTYLGARQAVGVWQNPQCLPPVLVHPDSSLAPRHKYRYAISARQENPNGGYSRRAVSLTTTFVSMGTGGHLGATSPTTGAAGGPSM